MGLTNGPLSCHGGLRENVDHIIRGIDHSGRYLGHYFYAWFVYHYQPLHPFSRELLFADAPFMCRLGTLFSPSEQKSFMGFLMPRSIIWNNDSFKVRDHSSFVEPEDDTYFCDCVGGCSLGYSSMQEAQPLCLSI